MALEFQWGRMRRLDPEKIAYLIVHTQGSPGGTDSSAEAIHRYHQAPAPRGRGWSGIGYHKVIRKDGTVELGRPEIYRGAHVDGLNHASLGICCTGNGNFADFTDAQKISLARELAAWMDEYQVPIGRVLGHREVNTIPGVPRTDKPCPGTRVSMRRIRSRVLVHLMENYPVPEITSYPDPFVVPELPWPDPV